MPPTEKPQLIVHRETLEDRLVHLLQESILSGTLKPQMKLREVQVVLEAKVFETLEGLSQG
jgi:DNA-binding GntR family transcriptional regulator